MAAAEKHARQAGRQVRAPVSQMPAPADLVLLLHKTCVHLVCVASRHLLLAAQVHRLPAPRQEECRCAFGIVVLRKTAGAWGLCFPPSRTARPTQGHGAPRSRTARPKQRHDFPPSRTARPKQRHDPMRPTEFSLPAERAAPPE